MLPGEIPFSPDPEITGYHLPGTLPGGIFLHGFRSNCHGEKALALTRHARCRGKSWYRFNQRHCGLDDFQFAKFTLSGAISDALDVLDRVRQPMVLVGSSLGGLIALEAARQSPSLVRGLLLLAPAYKFAQRYFLSIPAAEVGNWSRSGFRQFPDDYDGGSFNLEYGFYQDLQQYPRQGPWKFDFPVTILHGEHDEILPPEDSFELREMIQSPAIDLRLVSGGNHRLSDSIPLMCEKLDVLW